MTATGSHRGRVIEVVGLAGTGKSTIVPHLMRPGGIPGAYRGRRGGWYQPSALFDAFAIAHLAPRVLRCSLRGEAPLPAILGLYETRRRFLRDELVHLASLNAFLRLMSRQRRSGTGTMLLDEGPLYRLARLRTFGHASASHPSFERWRAELLAQCARHLDAIVWLDADNSVLIERIHSRAKHHRGRERPRRQLEDFLERNRAAYGATLDALTGHADIPLIRIDTGAATPEQVASEIASALTLAIHASPSGMRA